MTRKSDFVIGPQNDAIMTKYFQVGKKHGRVQICQENADDKRLKKWVHEMDCETSYTILAINIRTVGV